MIVFINERNEIVLTSEVTVEVPDILIPQLETYQDITDYTVTLGDNDIVIGLGIRGFQGEIQNLWNVRKENLSLKQQVNDLNMAMAALMGGAV